METAKVNQKPKIPLQHIRNFEECPVNSQPLAKENVTNQSNIQQTHYLPGPEIFIKTENCENGCEILDDLETFPTNSSIVSNVCNVTLPISSTSARIAEMIKADSFFTSQIVSKNKRIKGNKSNGTLIANNLEQTHASSTVSDIENDSLQYGENKQSEVLKAAKSLFSKRTRTLYHWMYPNASKQQLKLAITNSWETLSTEEKEFYISQVLGRFGFPQRSLMVNPQLGCINSIAALSPFTANTNLQTTDETRNAVSSILVGDNLSSGSSKRIGIDNNSYGTVKRRKLYRKRNRGRRNDTTKLAQEIVNTDEFQDDPELNREFQQFKWTLRMSDDGK